MAASRRGQPELHVRLPTQAIGPVSSLTATTPSLVDLPPISALFLIEFDIKAGYTISWKAAHSDVDLEGAVEYKSLPSGLHAVSEDLIYFVHEQYAGLSAFINAPVEDSQLRNARMLAVGVLVPLSYGRLGRAWRHAEGLKELVSALSKDVKDIAALQQYWDKHHARDDKSQEATKTSSLDSPSVTFQSPTVKTPTRGHARKRSASDGAGMLTSGHKLSPYHPAWSLTNLLDTFGPLIFPIHRAAMLRKRILISCHAPVRESCNFVYDISILSNIPLSTMELLSPEAPAHRLRPLFTVGVHDIPFLVDDAKQTNTSTKDDERGTGWIACTTDSILAMKETLWDVLITMPPSHVTDSQEQSWPTVQGRGGVAMKATQRDLRRYKALMRGLARLNGSSSGADTSPAASRPHTAARAEGSILDEAENIVEPHTWAALAYNGFMWWASAGEQARSDEAEEAAQDASLLADLSNSMTMPRAAGDIAGSVGSLDRPRRMSAGAQRPDEAQVELAIIAYFHRLTSNILSVAGEVVETMRYNEIEIEGGEDTSAIAEEEAGSPTESEQDRLLADDGSSNNRGEDEDEDDTDSIDGGRGVRIDHESISRMGLDVWSLSDGNFACELLHEYYGRRAYVEGKVVEVCGVRVC